MNKTTFVTPRALLSPGAGLLGRLAGEAAFLAEATRVLRDGLGPPLADHASVAAVRERVLVVVVDSPVWASRLRYQSEKILNHFSEALPGPRPARIRTLVRPRAPAATPLRRAAAPPSRSSRALLRDLSETLEPGPLRECLERFSTHDGDPPARTARTPSPTGGWRPGS